MGKYFWLIVHIYIYIYIYIYNKKIIYKNCCQRSSLASSKVFIRWWPWVQAWFWGRSVITTNPGRPSSISQYYQTLLDGVFICTNAICVQMQLQSCFGSFYIYSLFFAGISLILVKNVEVAFEIKPRHPISRGNMSVDQSFLVHCSRRSLYFSNFCWCAQLMLVSKWIVNSAMITFFELTDLMTRSGRCQVDVIFTGKASCRSTSAITHQSMQLARYCWRMYIYIYIYILYYMYYCVLRECHCGVMDNELDYGIVVSKFEPQ